MKNILDEFMARRSLVTNMNYQESRSRISGFLDWLDANEVTASVLSETENTTKVVEILKKASFHIPPAVSSPEDIVQIGLYFMRQVKLGKEVWGLSQAYGIQPSFSTRKVQHLEDEVINRYIEPAIEYIQDKLIEKMETFDNMTSISSSQADPQKVFVIHGRNKKARDAMFTFLRAIGLQPLEWQHAISLTSNASPYIGQILENAFHTVQAFVVLLSGDDEARLRVPFQKESDEDYEKNLTPQARPNVIFEAGLAFGIHPDRVVLVEFEKIRPFSDVFGRFAVRITNDIAARQDLAVRLRTVGCKVNLDGTDWHNAGDFDSAIFPFAKNSSTPKEPDNWYYHFRFQKLVAPDGKAEKPKHIFNQSKNAFDNIAENLKLGKKFQLEGVTVGGFEINNGFVSLSILRSGYSVDTMRLKSDNASKEKYWNSLKLREGIVDITSELKVFDPYEK
jgi:predicted nucleotide-binding protein